MEKIYRGIIALLILFQAAWFALPWSPPVLCGSGLDGNWLEVGYIFNERLAVIISIAFTVFYFSAYLGLLFFQAWARILLVVTCLAGGLIIPFYGTSVEPGLRAMAGYFLTLGEGGLIFMSYFSSISVKFVSRK